MSSEIFEKRITPKWHVFVADMMDKGFYRLIASAIVFSPESLA